MCEEQKDVIAGACMSVLKLTHDYVENIRKYYQTYPEINMVLGIVCNAQMDDEELAGCVVGRRKVVESIMKSLREKIDANS